MRTLKASALYFSLVFGAGFVLGSTRVPFLMLRLGERLAELVEMPLMLAVVLWQLVMSFAAMPWLLPQAAANGHPRSCTPCIGGAVADVRDDRGLAVGVYCILRSNFRHRFFLAMLVVFVALPALLPYGAGRNNS